MKAASSTGAEEENNGASGVEEVSMPTQDDEHVGEQITVTDDEFGMEDDLEALARAAESALEQNSGELEEEFTLDGMDLGSEDTDDEPDEPEVEIFTSPLAVKLSEKVEELNAELEGQKKALREAEDRLLRSHAEFDNFKKRMRKERQNLTLFANEEILRELLVTLDHFEKALEACADHQVSESFVQGFEMISNQMVGILQRFGLKPMEAVGKTFDPNYHEAVMRDENSELPENTVTQEFRKGYFLHERVLRQSMVSVSTRPAAAAKTAENDSANAEGETHDETSTNSSVPDVEGQSVDAGE